MKNKAKRIVSAVCALAMCAAMLPAAAMAEETTTSGPVVKNGVTIDKTAMALDENDQTNVTLSIGGTEDKEDVAVLFVLDYSTSIDVRNAAADLLEELAAKENTNVKACVINYWADAQTGEWKTITSETNTDDLLKEPENSGGTNIHAGLLAAQEALDSEEINGYETYLITISDGLTYLWTEEGVTQSVWYQQGSNGEYSIQNGNSVIEMKYPGETAGTSTAIPEGVFNALVTADESIITKYQNTRPYFSDYSAGYEENVTPYISFQPDWEGEDGKTTEDFLIGTEIAIYKTSEVFNQLKDKVDNVVTLKMDENHWGQYPYGEQLMNWMIGKSDPGSGMVTNDTAKTVFNGIRDQILYAIKDGTVTDVIGDDFDVAGLDSFVLTVGGKPVDKQVNESGNTINFGTPNENGVYPYTVTYCPNGVEVDAREQFVWTINVPVDATAPVKLTYTLNLVNKETSVGEHTTPTNEEATLTYESTDGTQGDMTFPKPEVTYTVDAPDAPGYDVLKSLLDVEVRCTTNSSHPIDNCDLLEGSYSIEVSVNEAGNDVTATLRVVNDKYVEHYNTANPGTTHTLADNTVKGWEIKLKYDLEKGAWYIPEGTSNSLYFLVSCPETVTVPSTPTPDEHPDIAEGIANGTWGGTPTPTPTAQTTAIPQTSDDLPLGLLIVVAIAAAGAVCGLVVLRKRSKQ